MKAHGLKPSELKATGYSARELKVSRRASRTHALPLVSLPPPLPRGARRCARCAMQVGGYTIASLKAAEFTAAQLKAGGFAAKALKGVGFSAAELKDNGFSAQELREGTFTAKDLKPLGYSVDELRVAGFTASNLKNVRARRAERSGPERGRCVPAPMPIPCRRAPHTATPPAKERPRFPNGCASQTATLSERPRRPNGRDASITVHHGAPARSLVPSRFPHGGCPPLWHGAGGVQPRPAQGGRVHGGRSQGGGVQRDGDAGRRLPGSRAQERGLLGHRAADCRLSVLRGPAALRQRGEPSSATRVPCHACASDHVRAACCVPAHPARAAGCVPSYPHTPSPARAQAKDAGLSAKKARAAGYTAAEAAKAGFTVDIMKQAGYSARELKEEASHSAAELKAVGFELTALRSAGFSAQVAAPWDAHLTAAPSMATPRDDPR